MTILESIKCILQQSNKGLTSKQIYEKIIHQDKCGLTKEETD